MIPLTIVGPERSTDLVLPAHVPIALLNHELADLVGYPVRQLATVAGRALDPSLGLADNGVAGGALLLVRTADHQVPVVDDIVDAVAPHAGATSDRLDPGSVGLALLAAVIASCAISLGSVALSAMLCCIALLGWVLLPRAALWIFRLDADANPAQPGSRERISVAQSGALHGGRALAACALGGGVALAHDAGTIGVAAGWLVLLSVTFRTAGRERQAPLIALTAIVAAIVIGSARDGWIPLLVALGGAVIAGCLLCSAGTRPGGRVLRQCGERVVAFAAPITLLAASGVLPAVPA